MIEQLEQIIRELCKEEINVSASISTYLSSFQIMVLLHRIESKFGVSLSY